MNIQQASASAAPWHPYAASIAILHTNASYKYTNTEQTANAHVQIVGRVYRMGILYKSWVCVWVVHIVLIDDGSLECVCVNVCLKLCDDPHTTAYRDKRRRANARARNFYTIQHTISDLENYLNATIGIESNAIINLFILDITVLIIAQNSEYFMRCSSSNMMMYCSLNSLRKNEQTKVVFKQIHMIDHSIIDKCTHTNNLVRC